MDTLWAWLRNIVLLLLFILGVELLLPWSGYRRYLKLVAGMILVLVVLEPALALLGGGAGVPGLSRGRVPPAAGAADFLGGVLPGSAAGEAQAGGAWSGSLARQVQATVERQVQVVFQQRVASSVRDVLLGSGVAAVARVQVTLAGPEIVAVRVWVRPRDGHLSAEQRDRLGNLVARHLGIPPARVAVEEG